VALLAKVANQIAESAIAIAKIAGDVLQGTLLEEESPKGFIPSVQSLRGQAKEALTE
jgi:hypothetical protein